MNIGQIPGYYYDEVTKKYFKIQANHVAPSGAKYARANVRREKRANKKRKLDEQRRERRAVQTVLPSSIQRHGVARIGLAREVGASEPAFGVGEREEFVISQLRPEMQLFPAPNATAQSGTLFDAVPARHPSINTITVLAYNHGMGSSIYDAPQQSVGHAQTQTTLVADSALVGLHVCSHPEIEPILMACFRESSGVRNVFVGKPTQQLIEAEPEYNISVGIRRKVDSALWSSAVVCDDDNLAVSGSDGIYIIDVVSGTSNHNVELEAESRCITWLEPQTVAFGTGRTVALYDTRSGGKANRFERPHPVTGIDAPGGDAMHLVVSDNKSLNYYDTRMDTRPLFEFRHLHQGPQLEFSCWRANVVSAVDVNNDVQNYSLKTGRNLGRLAWSSTPGEPLFRRLKWKENRYESVLQACYGTSVVRWTYGGAADDEG
ncbi:hypothetical protein B0A50_05415 [Salinomyces thailandicus]|uniref:Uncharacterized protein n=1 Tax=Salinomyces thailandicus TaxID=706561 RepID=A0A4U0TTP4_9PEZI|nr:hypothetical protein B0A50_05415 [Salinomyces thailandica]